MGAILIIGETGLEYATLQGFRFDGDLECRRGEETNVGNRRETIQKLKVEEKRIAGVRILEGGAERLRNFGRFRGCRRA